MFVLTSLSYFFGDMLPEWDAILATPLIWQQCGLGIVTDQRELEDLQAYQWSHMLIYFSTAIRMICAGAIILAVLSRFI